MDIAEKLESPIPKGEVIPMRQPVDESDGDELEINEDGQRPPALTDRYPDRESGTYKPPLPPKSNSITSATRDIPLKSPTIPIKNARSPDKLRSTRSGASNQSSFA